MLDEGRGDAASLTVADIQQCDPLMLVWRPLGLVALAEAVGWLHHHPEGPGIDMQAIIAKLQAFDSRSGFENVHQQSILWYGVTYNPNKKRMEMAGKSTAADLLKYLLGGFVNYPDLRDQLLSDFRDARTLPGSGDTVLALNWDGTNVGDSYKIELPPLLTS